ncbi:MAG: hypothetical protein K8F91_11190 [Candidatus Obscuribacterales bacterium]|nr:hypothetical protein [Candidatus Obscuribacterales bacterium]
MFTPVSIRPPEQWQDNSINARYKKHGLEKDNPLVLFLSAIDNSIESTAIGIASLTNRMRRRSRKILGKRIQEARRQYLRPEKIEELMQDPNPLVRMELAWNQTISKRVLLRLRKDEDSLVSEVAKIRLERTKSA